MGLTLSKAYLYEPSGLGSGYLSRGVLHSVWRSAPLRGKFSGLYHKDRTKAMTSVTFPMPREILPTGRMWRHSASSFQAPLRQAPATCSHSGHPSSQPMASIVRFLKPDLPPTYSWILTVRELDSLTQQRHRNENKNSKRRKFGVAKYIARGDISEARGAGGTHASRASLPSRFCCTIWVLYLRVLRLTPEPTLRLSPDPQGRHCEPAKHRSTVHQYDPDPLH